MLFVRIKINGEKKGGFLFFHKENKQKIFLLKIVIKVYIFILFYVQKNEILRYYKNITPESGSQRVAGRFLKRELLSREGAVVYPCLISCNSCLIRSSL